MNLSDWVDVSYTKLSGKWVKNLKTGEVKRVDVEPEPEPAVVRKPAPVLKKNWKNNAP